MNVRHILVDGRKDVWIRAGTEYISDAVSFNLAPASNVAITIQYEQAPVGQTTHSGSRETSYLTHSATAADESLPNFATFEHWFQIAALDVVAPDKSFSLVALGDSITDRRGSTTNGNDRWPDLLARKLAPRQVGVLNQGIGGNRILDDGLGPNVLARFDRDVLTQSGARYVVILEGVNDLGSATRLAPISSAEHQALVERLEDAYRQIALRAHALGLQVIGATILPYGGFDYYHPSAANEEDRRALNQWILHSGTFDATVDLSHALADPQHPEHLSPSYDSGDHLHPSPAGYDAMATEVERVLHQFWLRDQGVQGGCLVRNF